MDIFCRTRRERLDVGLKQKQTHASWDRLDIFSYLRSKLDPGQGLIGAPSRQAREGELERGPLSLILSLAYLPTITNSTIYSIYFIQFFYNFNNFSCRRMSGVPSKHLALLHVESTVLRKLDLNNVLDQFVERLMRKMFKQPDSLHVGLYKYMFNFIVQVV